MTKQDLIDARTREDWNYLWLQAVPLVKLAIKRLQEKGSLDPEHATEDLLQTGVLSAGTAVRLWEPDKGAFSTWIMAYVKRRLLNHIEAEANGMIGGRESGFEEVSLHDLEEGDYAGDDESVETGIETGLTYEYAPDGTPEGLRDPAEEAQLLSAPEEVARLLAGVDYDSAALVRSAFGLEPPQEKIPRRTARWRVRKSLAYLAASVRKPSYLP